MSLDVHPPHEPIHSWRDFLLHLLTITIGLLIAVGIEGIVEWQHHRHLAHEAEASLNIEIAHNHKQLAEIKRQIQSQRRELAQDLTVLGNMRGGTPIPQNSMSIHFSLGVLDNVSWRTAQSTGALAYMPYRDAQKFATVYEQQDILYRTQQNAVDDGIHATAIVATHEKLSAQDINEMLNRIGILQVRLQFVEAVVDQLDSVYQQDQPRPKKPQSRVVRADSRGCDHVPIRSSEPARLRQK